MHASRTTLVLLVALVLPGAGARSVHAEETPAETTPAFWLEKAEGLAARIEHPEGRAALLVSIGTGWVEAGENERARPLLASAVKYGAQCRGCISKARRLAEVASLQHRAGDVEGAARTFLVAREAVNELDGAARIQARAYLAQLWHAAGGEEEAQGLLAKSAKAAGLLKGLERAEALSAVADAQALVGNVAEAGRALDRLARAVAEVGADAAPILAGSQLTAAVADIVAGRLGRAEETLALVHDPSLAVSGYVSLARGAHAAGDVEGGHRSLGRAVELAEAVTPLVDRLSAWREIARIAAEIHDARAATQALDGMTATCSAFEEPQACFRAGIVRLDVLREAGDEEGLERGIVELVQQVERLPLVGGTRDALRALLVGLAARAGRMPVADAQGDAIRDPARQARARLEIADAARQTGEAADALARVAAVLAQVAAWEADPMADLAADRDEVLRQAAVIQAACGRPDEALKTVDAIVSPFHAATACTYVARDLR